MECKESTFGLTEGGVFYFEILMLWPQGTVYFLLKMYSKFEYWFLQLLCWMFHNDILPTSEQLNTCLMCMAVILQNQQLSAVIGQKDHVSWVASIVSSIYQVFLSCKYLFVLYALSYIQTICYLELIIKIHVITVYIHVWKLLVKMYTWVLIF